MLEKGERGRWERELTYSEYSLCVRPTAGIFGPLLLEMEHVFPTHDSSLWIEGAPLGSTLTFSPAPSLTPPQGNVVSHLAGGFGRGTSSRAQPLPPFSAWAVPLCQRVFKSWPLLCQQLPHFLRKLPTSIQREGSWQPCSCSMISLPGLHLPGFNQGTLTTLGQLESLWTLEL